MRVSALLLLTAVAAAISLAACSGQVMPGPAFLDSWGETGKEPGQLFQPTGIAVSKEGTVFVADTGNNRIQAFTSDGQFLWQFGRSGEAGGEFRRPMDLDLDGDGLLYVAELGGDRIQIFTPKGALVRTIRGEDTPAGSFDGAAGVLVAPDGDLYVADFYNDRVVRFSPGGDYHSVLGKPGRVLPGRLHYPTDVAWRGGEIVVADAYNNRVQVFTPQGESVARWGGPLGSGLPGSGSGSFRVATGVAIDAAERTYVADFDNHRIQVFDDCGTFLTSFGSHGRDPGQFERPTDLDFGADGRIYVVDFGNNRIQVFAPLPARQR